MPMLVKEPGLFAGFNILESEVEITLTRTYSDLSPTQLNRTSKLIGNSTSFDENDNYVGVMMGKSSISGVAPFFLAQPGDTVVEMNQTEKDAVDDADADPANELQTLSQNGLDVTALKVKSLSLHWELMFSRSMFNTWDMQKQHDLLNHVSQLIDDGVIKTTFGENYGTINAENLKRAHAHIETNQAVGKVVLEGFES